MGIREQPQHQCLPLTSVSHPHPHLSCECWWKPEVLGLPGAQITSICKPPSMGNGTQTRVLCKNSTRSQPSQTCHLCCLLFPVSPGWLAHELPGLACWDCGCFILCAWLLRVSGNLSSGLRACVVSALPTELDGSSKPITRCSFLKPNLPPQEQFVV